jgi:hypothetical protein
MRIPELTDRMKQVFAGIGQMFTAADQVEQGGQPADQAAAGPGPRTAMAFGGPDGSAATRSPHGGLAGGAGSGHGPGGGAGQGGPSQDSATRGDAGHSAAGGRGRTGRPGKNERSRRSAAQAAAAADARWRSLDKTGNVRLLSAEDLALEFPDQVTPPPASSPAPPAAVPPPPAVPPAPASLTFSDASLADPPATSAAPPPVAPPAPATLTFTDESVADTPVTAAPAADYAAATDYATPDYAAPADFEASADSAADAADVADSPDETAVETWADTYASVVPPAATDDLDAAAPPDTMAADIADTVDTGAEALVAAPDLAEAGDPAVGGPAGVEPAAPPVDLPVPNYDGLSLPSLRARLRGLDVPQLRTLVDYERANAARADVITMFERRIEKLTAGQ